MHKLVSIVHFYETKSFTAESILKEAMKLIGQSARASGGPFTTCGLGSDIHVFKTPRPKLSGFSFVLFKLQIPDVYIVAKYVHSLCS